MIGPAIRLRREGAPRTEGEQPLRPSLLSLLLGVIALESSPGLAGQVPGSISAPDIPVSTHDRVYAAEQFSNTVSVTDPVENKLLGVIRLGDPQPINFSPLYRGQLLVHGMGFSPDHRSLAVVSIGSNSVTFIDTATNAVKHGEKGSDINVRVSQLGPDVEISVANHGKGINPEDVPRLFSRFGRSSTAQGAAVPGLGLGLYIAKGLVEAHGGRIWVDSVPDKTTTFHFTLPGRAPAKEAA